MEQADILATLRAVFREVFDNDGILLSPKTNAGDIDGWDSFANIRLMVSIEEAFGVRFDVSEFEGFHDVGDLAVCLQRHLK
jgi:acyl carrier protein